MKFAIPAIVANIVNALYNIVDQIFIGQNVGFLGNAAMNVAFPLWNLVLAIGLMIGIGSSSNFNLELGKKNYDKAKKIIGTTMVLLILVGIMLEIFMIMFLGKLLFFFGATAQTIGYASDYAKIVIIGVPMLLIAVGMSPLIRGDGSPKYSMYSIIIGAILNIFLDWLFIYIFNMGIKGAAYATLISQIISSLIVLNYFRNFKSIKLHFTDFFKLDLKLGKAIFDLGMASFLFQMSTMLVHISVNNMLKTYGSISKYGSDIPLAGAGIILKLNVVYISILIGLIQGGQPIIGYNYGAKQYDRVREVTTMLLKYSTILSIIVFLIYQIFPVQIISIFGNGDKLYFEFTIKFIRIYGAMIFLNGFVSITTKFFPAIGKGKKGNFLALFKQLFLLLPLVFLLPNFFGITGIALAIPISEILAFIICFYMLKKEYKMMKN